MLHTLKLQEKLENLSILRDLRIRHHINMSDSSVLWRLFNHELMNSCMSPFTLVSVNQLERCNINVDKQERTNWHTYFSIKVLDILDMNAQSQRYTIVECLLFICFFYGFGSLLDLNSVNEQTVSKAHTQARIHKNTYKKSPTQARTEGQRCQGTVSKILLIINIMYLICTCIIQCNFLLKC